MIRRRRVGATVALQLNVNPESIPDDLLSSANLLQIHVQPPNGGTEIQLAATAVGWLLSATLPFSQHNVPGEWQADAYAQFNSGIIIKIGKTIAWQADPKYTYP